MLSNFISSLHKKALRRELLKMRVQLPPSQLNINFYLANDKDPLVVNAKDEYLYVCVALLSYLFQ